MNPEQLRIVGTEEMDNPDGAKKEKSPNVLQEILAELMTSRGVQMADIHKATGIPYPTLCDWSFGNVQTQKLDRNILKLAQYFNVTIEYLGFGIGSDEPYYEKIGNSKSG